MSCEVAVAMADELTLGERKLAFVDDRSIVLFLARKRPAGRVHAALPGARTAL